MKDEKEELKREIIMMIEGIENKGKLKFLLAVLKSYLGGRGENEQRGHSEAHSRGIVK